MKIRFDFTDLMFAIAFICAGVLLVHNIEIAKNPRPMPTNRRLVSDHIRPVADHPLGRAYSLHVVNEHDIELTAESDPKDVILLSMDDASVLEDMGRIFVKKVHE